MKQVEFLIVGQGLAATTLAFEMKKQGVSFHIVASPIKSKASVVAAGMVNPLVFKRLTKSWMVDELLQVMNETYQYIEHILGEQLFFEKEILKPLSEQEKKLWQERKQLPEFSKYIKEIKDDSPVENVYSASGYGIVSSAGYLKLSRFLSLAEDYFLSHDFLSKSDFSFQNLNPEQNTFEIDGIKAKKIVFCEGYHVTQNPFFNFIKMNPVKGEVLQIYSEELSEKYLLNKSVFILPVGNHRFKVGSTYEWKDLTEVPTEEGKKSIVERLENLVNVDYSIENHWAGVRPAVSDRRPVLGVHPKYSNLFVFNGLGTKGVMLAPFFAREMVRLCLSVDYQLSKDVSVARFFNS